MTEIVRKLLSTDGAGLVTTEEGRVLPSLQTDVAQPSLVLLLHLPGLPGRLVSQVRDPVLNLDAALQALLHFPAAIKAGNLNNISIKGGYIAINRAAYLVSAG